MAIHDEISNSHSSLERGRVWCRECGATHKVNSTRALQYGWPKCCGYTMTIDSPEEQKQLAIKGKLTPVLTGIIPT